MADQLQFDGTRISDQKRFVRGEQYLAARTALRVRDFVHHAKWRVLIMAGGSPRGEVRAIQELMPRAHITAVDRDERCLQAAIDAGVDEVVQCDLSEFSGQIGTTSFGPATALRALPPWDVVSLDLCGVANPTTKKISKACAYLVSKRGVFILTFSYGRDVIEAIKKQPIHNFDCVDGSAQAVFDAGASDLLLRRISYLFDGNSRVGRGISSIFTYRGAEMPMCSVLCGGELITTDKGVRAPSFVQVERGDFELAVCYPESAALYDCPQDRIDALRRKHAAIKASYTRLTKAAQPLLFEAEPQTADAVREEKR